jgi:hypothetical protein
MVSILGKALMFVKVMEREFPVGIDGKGGGEYGRVSIVLTLSRGIK